MKRFLADTHAIVWFAGGHLQRLGPRARRAFAGLATGSAEIAVSVVTLWEISGLHDEGTIRLPSGFAAWCDALEAMSGVSVVPLVRADIEAARSLRALVEPHDRLIAGTSLRMGVPLLTRDARVAGEGRVKTVW